jgi:hypothetical protein
VNVICRKEDVSLVKDVLGDAVSEYRNKLGKPVDATIDSATFLPPGPSESGAGDMWYGCIYKLQNLCISFTLVIVLVA